MLDHPDDLLLRPIESTDDASKLSLGKSQYVPLKTFLKKTAFEFHQYEIAKTFVLVNQNETPRIFGYITLMSSEIILNEGQRPSESSATIKYEAFSAVKIARLAIDQSLQSKGFGRKLLDWCINHVQLTVMPNIGCRFLVVDAKRDSIGFYEKNGFTLLDTTSNHTDEHPLMFFDLHKSNI